MAGAQPSASLWLLFSGQWPVGTGPVWGATWTWFCGCLDLVLPTFNVSCSMPQAVSIRKNHLAEDYDVTCDMTQKRSQPS